MYLNMETLHKILVEPQAGERMVRKIIMDKFDVWLTMPEHEQSTMVRRVLTLVEEGAKPADLPYLSINDNILASSANHLSTAMLVKVELSKVKDEFRKYFGQSLWNSDLKLDRTTSLRSDARKRLGDFFLDVQRPRAHLDKKNVQLLRLCQIELKLTSEVVSKLITALDRGDREELKEWMELNEYTWIIGIALTTAWTKQISFAKLVVSAFETWGDVNMTNNWMKGTGPKQYKLLKKVILATPSADSRGWITGLERCVDSIKESDNKLAEMFLFLCNNSSKLG